MTTDSVTVSPPAIDVAGVTLSAVVEHAADGQGWNVTVVINRPPDQPRLSASDVTASLTDLDGHALPLVGWDSGALVEAGGSLGVSVNANFLFAASDRPPIRLSVTYQDATVEFELDAVRPG